MPARTKGAAWHIGVIGGSGLAGGVVLDEAQDIAVASPFGAPSGPVTTGWLGPVRFTFLARHGVSNASTIVAYDGMGVIVNQGNALAALTKRQVEQIFAGDITDWSQVGGNPGKISIYTRNTSSGTYSDFKDLAMKKRDYASSSQKMAGNEQIASEVAKNPAGIGYVGLAYLSDPGIKTVSIDGILPNEATVMAGKYPYARPTFYYTNGEATGEAAKFIEFTLSDEGQKIVRKVGFVPVRQLN